MKRLLSTFILCALALSLAGCGTKRDVLTAPPELTVTNAQDASITVSSGSYDWNYALGNGERSGAIACGAHPLDESCRDITPVLEMPIAVSASYFYTVTLGFGGCAPDSVSLRYWSDACWGDACWGDTEARSETIPAQRQDDGTYIIESLPSIGIFAVDAAWDTDDYQGTATYVFCTKAAGTQELFSNTRSFGGDTPITKLDVSWVSGSVYITSDAQIREITVTEHSAQELAEEEQMTFRLDTDSNGTELHIGFMQKKNFEGEKDLTVTLPTAMLDAGLLREIDIDATSARVGISAGAAQKIDISTVSGEARVMGASCPEVEIETTSGTASVVDGTWQRISVSTVSGAIEIAGDAEAVDAETTSGDTTLSGSFGKVKFESVSGGLSLLSERAFQLDAETTSGDVKLTLPENDGVDLDFETTSGTLESPLTERKGTMIACGDHETHYSVPALKGGGMNTLEVSTVSGNLNIE